MTAVPFQKRGVPEAAGLTRAQCEQAAWAVTPDGRRFRGAGAVNAALTWAVGCPAFLWIYRLPLVRQVQDALYDWIAANRSRLPGVTPYCEQHPEDCQ